MSSATLKKILAGALDLPEPERAELAHDLLTSLGGPGDPGSSDEWNAEISRRLDEFENGTAKTISGDEMLRRIARRIGKG